MLPIPAAEGPSGLGWVVLEQAYRQLLSISNSKKWMPRCGKSSHEAFKDTLKDWLRDFEDISPFENARIPFTTYARNSLGARAVCSQTPIARLVTIGRSLERHEDSGKGGKPCSPPCHTRKRLTIIEIR